MTATYPFDVFSSLDVLNGLDGIGAEGGDALDSGLQELVHRPTRHG